MGPPTPTLPFSIHAGLGSMPLPEALASIPRVDDTAIGAPSAPTQQMSAAAMLANLLPSANPSLQLPTGGVYMGDGIPPVPAKLAAKIRRGEFVDMGELLPEFWSTPRDEDTDGKHDAKARRSRKVTDIHTWVQCFSTYVATRATHAPQLIPELMAYLATIVRVSQDYSGLAWVRYDAAFRRQAALTGNTRWSTINSTLYTMCFTGMATATKRCELCFASTHSERECAQRGDPDPEMKDRLKAIEAAVLALTSDNTDRSKQPPSAPRPSGEVCRKWNAGTCTYPRCRHSHVCSNCQGSHPAVKCPRRFSPRPPVGLANTPAMASKPFQPRPY